MQIWYQFKLNLVSSPDSILIFNYQSSIKLHLFIQQLNFLRDV